MLYTIDFISEVFPNYKGIKLQNIELSGIMTDSREEKQQALFVPIVGDNFNAHFFIEQAKANGAVAALWDKQYNIPNELLHEMTFFIVEDTRIALQKLAHAYVKKVQPVVIGITGSNGKTTTKDLLQAVLQQTFISHATKGNFNNEIGLPLTILNMNNKTEVLILEMGMSDFGEIDLLSHIAEPDYAIITNIGESHIEQLKSRSGIAEAKTEIVNGMKNKGMLVIDGDEQLLTSSVYNVDTTTCGFNDKNDLVISEVKLLQDGTSFKWNGTENYTVPLFGEHHALNASFVITIAKALNMNQTMIQSGLETVKHTSMRFEKIIGKNNVTIINDAYNASPTSMKAAIQLLKQFTAYERRIVVLGDILELGELAVSFHEQVANVITPPIDVVYTYGDLSEVMIPIVKNNQPNIEARHFTNREALINILEGKANTSTIILFKGSRGMALEEIIHPLTLIE